MVHQLMLNGVLEQVAFSDLFDISFLNTTQHNIRKFGDVGSGMAAPFEGVMAGCA